MFTLNEFLTNEYESEHVLEHSLLKKKIFSAPKIYSANGDLNKRWHVYYSYRNPKSGKLKRQTPIYSNANKFKTKEERLTVLVTYRKALLKLLNKGYNPYEDNKKLHKELIENKNQLLADKNQKEIISKAVLIEKSKNHTSFF
jgi:hypothetical protein